MTTPDAYAAVLAGAGLVDRTARGLLAATGRDRSAYLQGLLTNDMTLASGEGRYAAFLTPQGRMIADMRAVELGDRVLLDLHASVTDLVKQRFEQLVFSEDVQVADLREHMTSVGVHGATAAQVVAGVLGGGSALRIRLETLVEHHASTATFRDIPVVIVRSGDLGLAGFDLYVDRAIRSTLRDALAAAGAVPLDADTCEVLRVEAGRPAFTIDMDADTIPLEAGIEERAISLTKGCYVGQEVIIRVLHRGHGRVAKRLVGLRVIGEGAEDAPVPRRGDVIAAGGRDTGRVTSAVRSPAVGSPIALGYVHRDVAPPGTRVELHTGDTTVPAEVSALPFVSRSERSG